MGSFHLSQMRLMSSSPLKYYFMQKEQVDFVRCNKCGGIIGMGFVAKKENPSICLFPLSLVANPVICFIAEIRKMKRPLALII